MPKQEEDVMSEDTVSKKSGIPAFKLIVLAVLFILTFFFWQNVLGNALFIAALFFAAFGWERCRHHGWLFVGGFLLMLVIAFGLNAGELWYKHHHSLPWFFGFESKFETYNGFKPVAFSILVAFALIALYYWILEPIIHRWNTTQQAVSETKRITAFVILGFVFWMTVVNGAYLNKIRNSYLGTITIGWATSSGATVADWTSDGLRELADDQEANIKLAPKDKPEAEKQ